MREVCVAAAQGICYRNHQWGLVPGSGPPLRLGVSEMKKVAVLLSLTTEGARQASAQSEGGQNMTRGPGDQRTRGLI